MARRYAFAAFTAVLVVLLGSLTGCGAGSINGPVTVGAGQKTGDVGTVNGSVNIEDGATVGSAATVNGSVSLGANATAGSLKTVNGEVKLGDSSHVSGNIATVNGAVLLNNGAEVAGKIANVNGSLKLVSAHVGGGITTVNGDIDVGAGSRVEGGIHIERPGMSVDSNAHPPRIVIGPHAVVSGGMRFEREVKLYISDSAQVDGAIEGATPEKFSGDQPTG
jgi:cytoskeletal protein CcmA (bactofilin family)